MTPRPDRPEDRLWTRRRAVLFQLMQGALSLAFTALTCLVLRFGWLCALGVPVAEDRLLALLFLPLIGLTALAILLFRVSVVALTDRIVIYPRPTPAIDLHFASFAFPVTLARPDRVRAGCRELRRCRAALRAKLVRFPDQVALPVVLAGNITAARHMRFLRGFRPEPWPARERRFGQALFHLTGKLRVLVAGGGEQPYHPENWQTRWVGTVGDLAGSRLAADDQDPRAVAEGEQSSNR